MDNLHHKPIKKFTLDGVINDESSIWRLKTEYLNLLISEMRLSGYVQRIDINPDFTLEYNEAKKYFEFELSIYGIYVGKRKDFYYSQNVDLEDEDNEDEDDFDWFYN